MVAKIITFIVIVATSVAVKAIVNPQGPTVVSDFTSCIKQIIQNDFKKPGEIIFIVTNNASTQVSKIRSDLMKSIHDKLEHTVEVMSPKKETNICDNYNEKLGILHIDNFETKPLAEYFLIIIDTYGDFSHVASRMARSRSWNPSAQFIILLFNFASNKANIQLIERILTCLFKYNVINIVVIVPEAGEIRNAFIYGWRPYDPPKYCGYFNETAQNRILVENKCEKGALKYNKSIFEDKLPANMSGCVLHIIALEKQPFVSRDSRDANIEKILINEIARSYSMKTNYEIINSFRGERETMGQWTGALKELSAKKGQVILGGIFPDFDVHEDFECSTPYLADSYTWVVPRAYQSPPWVALVIIFQKLVWSCVIAGFLLCALFWRVLGQLSDDRPYNKSLYHCVINAWICSLGFCSYVRPTRHCLRLFFALFNIYCIMVTTGYQTKLIDVLKNPTFEYQIQSIEELVESGLSFGGFEELHDLFENSTHYIDQLIYENWNDVSDISMAMLDVAVHRNFSLLCSRMELTHIASVMPELSDSYGNLKFYAFSSNMFSVPMEMVALRGFGFMQRFSRKLVVFKQMGVNEALKRRFVTFSNRRRATLMRFLLKEKSDVNSLSLQHLQGGFSILIVGYVSGTFLLALEIVSDTAFFRQKFRKYIR